MRGRLGWAWVTAVAAAAGGCGGTSPLLPGSAVQGAADAGLAEPADAGTSSGAVAVGSTPDAATDAGCVTTAGAPDGGYVRPVVRTTQLATVPAGTTKLLGDPAAVFGVTNMGMIWALDAGATTVRQVVPGANTTAARPAALTDQDLFWADPSAGTLHRTARDGTADVVLAGGLSWPSLVTADQSRVYWFEAAPNGGGAGGTIRSLPVDAAPGDRPDALATVDGLQSVWSMVATDGSLYWTPYEAFSTVYYASLVTAPVADLLAGGAGAALPGIEGPYQLTAAGAVVYFGYLRNLSTTNLGRIPEQNGAPVLISILPGNVSLAGLTITDQWLLASASDDETHKLQLYGCSKDGAGLGLVAVDLATPAVNSPWGIAYVNDAGALVGFPTAQLGYVIFGEPPP